jgi:hypothetical protein
MLPNSYRKTISEAQSMAYILRLISDGKNEEQIIEIFNGDNQLVKTWIKTLIEIHFITMNSFSNLVITPDGSDYFQKFDLHL